MKVVTIVGGHQVFAGTLDISPDFLLSNVGGQNTKDLCSLTLRSHSKEDDEVAVANFYPPLLRLKRLSDGEDSC